MAKQTVSVSVLKDILAEVDKGLNDKTRTIDSISDGKIKKIAQKSCEVVLNAGTGGAAAAKAVNLSAALVAGGLGVGAAVAGGLGAGAGAAGIALAAGGAGGVLAAAGGTAAILGGPVVWVIGGATALVSFLIGKGLEKHRKMRLAQEKEACMQAAIEKQNHIIRMQEETIKDLKIKQQKMSEQNAKMQQIIEGVIARIDYLNSLLVMMEAVKEACA